MTGILQDTLHEQAERAGQPALDVDSIMRAGKERVHRRRLGLAGGLAAATLVVGAAVSAWPGGGSSDDLQVAVDGTSASAQPLSWVEGDTVHRSGLADIQLPGHVHAWLWAGQGIAWTDEDLNVHVWSAGEDQIVGRAARADFNDVDRVLVADGTRIGWLDAESGFTVRDSVTGDVSSLASAGAAQGATTRLTALDGDLAYGVDARGAFVWDIATDQVEVLDQDPAGAVIDAESGVLLRQQDGSGVVTRDGREVRFPLDSFANLSPDGTVVTAESRDEGILLDTATGERIPYETGRDWSLPFQWLDDDQVAVLVMDDSEGAAEDRPEQPGLVTCRVSTGECTADPALPNPSQMVLPVGVHFGQG